MLPILTCLYGLAGFLCFLGYLFALVEWHMRQRQLGWNERLAITGVNPGCNQAELTTTKSTVQTVAQLDVQSKITELQETAPIQNELEESKGELVMITRTELQEVNPQSGVEVLEASTSEPTMDRGSPDQQPSWEQRRAERRQRYKAEKSRLCHSAEPEHVETVEVEEAETEESAQPMDWTVTDERRECTSEDSDWRTSPEDDTLRIRKYSVPEEIRAAHSMCSRRTSVQVTDLDEQLNVASVHLKEYVYGVGESTTA